MKEYYTQKQVMSRGWTKKVIIEFLGEPDKTAPNPEHKHGAPLRLFSISRVESVERQADFQSTIDDVNERRRERANRADNKLPEPNESRANLDTPPSKNINMATGS